MPALHLPVPAAAVVSPPPRGRGAAAAVVVSRRRRWSRLLRPPSCRCCCRCRCRRPRPRETKAHGERGGAHEVASKTHALPLQLWNVCSSTLRGQPRSGQGRSGAVAPIGSGAVRGTANSTAVHPYHRRRCGLPHPPVRPLLPGRVRGGLAPAAVLDAAGRSSCSSPATSSTAGGDSTSTTAATACCSSSSRWATRSSRHAICAGHGAQRRRARHRWPSAADLARAGLVQVRRVDRRRRSNDVRDGHAPPRRRHPADRRVVLRLPGHQLRGRHLPRAPPAGPAAGLRHLPVVLPAPRRRSDRAGAASSCPRWGARPTPARSTPPGPSG